MSEHMVDNHKQFNKFLQANPEIKSRITIDPKSVDKIGFKAIILTKKGRCTKWLRFDFPFNTDAIQLYIDEDPRQLREDEIDEDPRQLHSGIKADWTQIVEAAFDIFQEHEDGTELRLLEVDERLEVKADGALRIKVNVTDELENDFDIFFVVHLGQRLCFFSNGVNRIGDLMDFVMTPKPIETRVAKLTEQLAELDKIGEQEIK